MNKKEIFIPEGVYHLNDCPGLQSQFPQGSFILDKTITGCGATTMFLSDDIPTILCSARLELMHCKANAQEFHGKVHEFRKFGDRSSSVLTLENEMMDYVSTHMGYFSRDSAKVLVSYDSFKHVAQALSEKNLLGNFRIVVDEAQTLFTDASFKGDVEIEFLENLKYNNQVIFLSATPYIENYLDQMVFFKNLPYVELLWPESSIHHTNIEKQPYYRKSPKATATQIIQDYNNKGYFKDKIMDGKIVYSNEAVFYINDVGLIISIIKENNLTP
ncbi:MAG: DEAD/DEAH box helicase family protein, partial [Alphaproteobacteria bacterium]|nr:DEAD/DEAH box helicase family protein [Alphaproteobacteria bacterium]